jgi:hypothetical protein
MIGRSPIIVHKKASPRPKNPVKRKTKASIVAIDAMQSFL